MAYDVKLRLRHDFGCEEARTAGRWYPDYAIGCERVAFACFGFGEPVPGESDS